MPVTAWVRPPCALRLSLLSPCPIALPDAPPTAANASPKRPRALACVAVPPSLPAARPCSLRCPSTRSPPLPSIAHASPSASFRRLPVPPGATPHGRSRGQLAARAASGDPSGAGPSGEAAADASEVVGGSGQAPSEGESTRTGWLWRGWRGWGGFRGRESMGERVMSSIVNSGSAPIGSFIAEPVTALHRLDPRVKQLWLLMLVLLPARSGVELRLCLCAFLTALTLLLLPINIAGAQLQRSALFALIILLGLAFSTDGVPALVQPRPLPHALEPLALASSTAASAASAASAVPAAASVATLLPSGYRYVLLKMGPLLLTRKAAKLAVMAASLSFIILHAAAVSLITTSPEAMAGALRWGMQPLAAVGARVDAAILTLLLSLRFLGLVFDEVRSLALGVVARGVHWDRLQPLATLDLVLSLANRLFQNLFTHADQISQAMIARGFSGDPSTHRLYFLGDFGLHAADWTALLLLAALTAAAVACGLLLPA